MKYTKNQTVKLTFHYFGNKTEKGFSHLPYGSFDYDIVIPGNLYEKIVKWCNKYHMGELKQESIVDDVIKTDLFSVQDKINKIIYSKGQMPIAEIWLNGQITTAPLKSRYSKAKQLRQDYTPQELMRMA